jgi:acyl dehydratase
MSRETEMRTRALKVGDKIERRLVDGLTRTQIVQYAGASGDYNPVHTDEVFATQVAGYPSVFAHGMLTMGMTGRILTDLFGAHQVTRFGVRFTAQVWPGDTLDATATVTAIDVQDGIRTAKVTVSTRNQHGVEVVRGEGSARME